MRWILIFYMWGSYGGGPATATFDTQAACENAAVAIKASKLGHRFDGYVCVPQS